MYVVLLYLYPNTIIEGSLEAKPSDNMDRLKSTARKKLREGESQKREDKRWRRSEMEKVRDGEGQRGRKSEERRKEMEKIREGENQ